MSARNARALDPQPQPQAEPQLEAPQAVDAAQGVDASQAAMRNPPRAMQRELAQAVAAGVFEADADDRAHRWSQRRTLAFVVITCSAFWVGVGMLIARLG